MLKIILIFIKTHIVAVAITTTVVIGTAVATPIIVENYKKENDVKQNVPSNESVTVSSNNIETDNTGISNDTEITDNAIINESTEVSDNKITNNNSTTTDKPTNSNNSTENDDKPLTFRIEKIEHEDKEFGNWTEYEIVPSYDKDASKWTEEEKAEYDRMLQEVAKMAEADHYEAMEEEKQIMKEIEKSLEQGL